VYETKPVPPIEQGVALQGCARTPAHWQWAIRKGERHPLPAATQVPMRTKITDNRRVADGAPVRDRGGLSRKRIRNQKSDGASYG